MGLEFTTAKRRATPIEFTLDGRVFVFTPPKLAGAMLAALESDDNGEVLDWFASGLSEEDETFITNRLRDPDDDFDIDSLSVIVQSLVERVVGRPTKSPSGLRRRR